MKTWKQFGWDADQRLVDRMTWRELEAFIVSSPEPYVDARRWVDAVMYAMLLIEARDDLLV